jgi:adenylate kinase family enzyme
LGAFLFFLTPRVDFTNRICYNIIVKKARKGVFGLQKVMVIGCPGSGKSTFSRALRGKTGLPLYYLDMLYWNADKTTVQREVFRTRLAKILEADAFIIDGNYHSTLEMRFSACDTVFFLDYPTDVCLDGVRSRFGKPREDMPWIETEPDPEFMDYIRRFATENRPEILALIEKYPHVKVITFTSRAEADAYLNAIKTGDETL